MESKCPPFEFVFHIRNLSIDRLLIDASNSIRSQQNLTTATYNRQKSQFNRTKIGSLSSKHIHKNRLKYEYTTLSRFVCDLCCLYLWDFGSLFFEMICSVCLYRSLSSQFNKRLFLVQNLVSWPDNFLLHKRILNLVFLFLPVPKTSSRLIYLQILIFFWSQHQTRPPFPHLRPVTKFHNFFEKLNLLWIVRKQRQRTLFWLVVDKTTTKQQNNKH